MISFPNCKINLGLNILGKREDGYHNIQTIFYPLPLRDALEITVQKNRDAISAVQFTSSGLSIPGNSESNLCVKAYALLKNDFPRLPPIIVHLLKAIPIGAGLGGGSADGAFALVALNKKFELGLTTQQLLDYAARLGSDCPFFILNEPCIAFGRGEQLTPIDVDLGSFKLVLVNPGIHIDTGWAFSQLDHFNRASKLPLAEVIKLPVQNWREHLTNDFEIPVFKYHPELAEIRDSLYANAAVFCCMSGSGSSIFGLFPKNVNPILNYPPGYLVKQINL